jgi:hypothetical protein
MSKEKKILFSVITSVTHFRKAEEHFFQLGGYYTTPIPFIELYKNQTFTPKPNRLHVDQSQLYSYASDKLYLIVYDDASGILSQIDPGSHLKNVSDFLNVSDLLGPINQGSNDKEDKEIQELQSKHKASIIICFTHDERVILSTKGKCGDLRVALASALAKNKTFRELTVEAGSLGMIEKFFSKIKG